ncbi:MgtC/SapB family protein [Tianweitania populi]|uniref:Protein MgtC n=1 Tax=Tianweitania populi TaxID=1607949 RepID=A0A8J3GMN3_9HYPH|nr:MgtC/SapB family protein [Tianweitania populi]GHD18225.1 membrane protein [Tianweitania populi]
MEALFEEIGHPTVVPFPVLAARILLAAILGAVIGFEREWRNHSAGLRTHIMVCVAAAVFGILTVEITLSPVFANAPVQVDPIRAVEAVTAGVAFLAAGLIWAGRGKVHGLTTGAGMWLAGAIGLSSGLGLWQIALLATFVAIVILSVINSLSKTISGGDTDEPHAGAQNDQPSPARDASKPKT